MKLSLRLHLLVAALFAGATASAQSYTFTTVAGFATPFGSTDGVGSNARFLYPHYAVFGITGNLYVSDTFNHTIRGITPAGVVFTLLGQTGQQGIADPVTGVVRFSFPQGLAVDALGTLYVCESGNHIIRRFTSSGGFFFVGSAGLSGSADGTGTTARFNSPFGLAIGSDGTLYVADRGNRTIRKVTSAGVVTTLAGLAGSTGATDGAGSIARFSQPTDIAIDRAGNLYVADDGNSTIRKITAAGVVTTVAGLANTTGFTNGVGTAARFNTPNGIAVDATGNLFVSDSGNNCVRKIATDGTVTTFAGTTGTTRGNTNGTGTAARFYFPYGLTFDQAGDLFVVDSDNYSIRKITTAAVVTTLAGSGGTYGNANGTGDAARFSDPRGVVADSNGNVFVADGSNNAIRSITPGGAVTTFAGSTTGLSGTADGTGSAARFNFPYSLSIDRADNLYVADSNNHTIRKITPGGGVTTVAGLAGTTGSTDGTGSAARFNGPRATAVDRNGNVYVADAINHLIRKIAPDGNVTTVAGTAGVTGSADGLGTAASFNIPNGVAVDPAGNLYVADLGNSLIRKITPDGNVTTLAGSAGLTGSTDGTGGAARFRNPFNLAVDGAGNVFVADTSNNTVRKVTPAGVVTTIGGSAGSVYTGSNGTGTAARFLFPAGIFVDAKGVLYLTDNGANTVTRGVLDSTPQIPVPPQSLTVATGSKATFSVLATGGGLGYQWLYNGSPITGATGNAYTVPSPVATGSYSVIVTNSAGTTPSAAATLSVVTTTDIGRLVNLSILTTLPAPGDTFTVGAVLGGDGTGGPKPLLIRAAGPTLGTAPFNIPGALADPKLDVYSGQTVVASNNDWGGGATLAAAISQVGAFPYSTTTSKDAAVAYTASLVSPPGSYTVVVSGVGNATGIVIAEIYDATPSSAYTATTPRLINVSVLKNIGSGLTAGFYIGGSTARTVLIRAIGPTLADFGVGGALTDPKLELFSGQTVINENDDWKGTAALTAAFNNVGAFALGPSSKDAAILITLPPGAYTARVTGVGGATGSALVEVYEVP